MMTRILLGLLAVAFVFAGVVGAGIMLALIRLRISPKDDGLSDLREPEQRKQDVERLKIMRNDHQRRGL